MMITEDVNTFAIYVNCISQSEDTEEFSSALVINVISLSANHKRDICSQVSFDMWMKILKEDLKYRVAAVSDYMQCCVRSYWVRLKKDCMTYRAVVSGSVTWIWHNTAGTHKHDVTYRKS